MPGTPDESDHIAALHSASQPGAECGHVAVTGGETSEVLDAHVVAVSRRRRSYDHSTRGGGVDGCPARSTNVDAGVQTAPTHAERRRDRPLHWPGEAAAASRPG